MDILFIGGTGQISEPCVAHAVAEGHKVFLLNRGTSGRPLPDGVKAIAGDMNTNDPYANLGDQKFDVVCQFRAFTPEQIERDIATFAGRAGQYVFISSASVYEKPARHYVITEKTPAVNPFWAYSQQKIACETLIRQSTGLDWTIVRPSHTIRTGLPAQMSDGDGLGYRMLTGKPVLLSGDGTSLWTLTRPVDFAVPFVGLFGKDKALGEDFHISQHLFGYTWNQIYAALARGLGVEADIVHVAADTLVRYNPDWTGPLFGDKAWSALFDNSKVMSVAGTFTSESDLDAVVADSVASFKARAAKGAPAPGPEDALIDRIVKEQRALGN
jgi:nucleoside-diphosphate-sugar epimerase